MNEKVSKGTSVQGISNLVGIYKSTLFYYFKSKEDILPVILEEAFWKVIEFIAEIIKDKDLPSEEKLRKAIFCHIE